MAYYPPAPSPEEQKEWPCRFTLFSITKNEVQSIIREWRGQLSERPIEQVKLDVEETVDKCFEHLKNCTVRVDVLSYNSLRNTWPIHTTYDSHTRTWSR